MNKGERGSRGKLIATVVAACVAYSLMNYLLLAEIASHLEERPLYKSVIYLGWAGCGFLALFAVLITARRLPLYVLLLLFFVSVSTNYAYVVIAKVPLTLDVIEWLPHEVAQLSNVGSEYAFEIASAIVKAATVLAVLLFIGRTVRSNTWLRRHVLSRRWIGTLAIGTFAFFHGFAMLLQPPYALAETNLFVFGVPSLFASTPAPRSISAQPVRAPLVEKIVVVVDESVTHEAFEKLIASRLRHFPLTDFGEAASTANCSAPSNALLRWGVEKARIRDPDYDPRTNPMVWGYAKGAGFRTVLIDGQSQGSMHNYVNIKEFALIDEFVPAESDADTDRRIAAMLNERLSRPGRELIYVVKRGAHFPYEMNYPRAMAPPNATRTTKYVAAVLYTTGGFFERLSADLPFSNILMLYTSDHGQDFSERAAHCNAHPKAEEYAVPLIGLTAAPALTQFLGGSPLRDRASHLNIFATVLYALGYEQTWLEDTYGPTLAGPPSPYLTYVNRGWRARGNRNDRHTVKATDFVESTAFPRRSAAETRRPMLNVTSDSRVP